MKIELLGKIFDIKTVQVIKALLTKRGRFYLRDLSRESGVSLATTYRIIQKLKKIGVVYKDGKEKIEFYELDRNSENFAIIKNIFMESEKKPAKLIKNNLHQSHGSEPRIYYEKNNENKIIVVSSLTEKREIYNLKKKLDEEVKIVLFSNYQFIEMKNAGFIKSKTLTEV
tara:strand:- start:56 stop:565 length:510 start_codon:yes stop_codon:yes gene_type:complete